jgi:hypothetical protein
VERNFSEFGQATEAIQLRRVHQARPFQTDPKRTEQRKLLRPDISEYELAFSHPEARALKHVHSQETNDTTPHWRYEERKLLMVYTGIVVGTILGLLLGCIPLITAMKKNQVGLALGGFIACIISGAVLGCILGLLVFWAGLVRRFCGG